jgi:hypothetical protein
MPAHWRTAAVVTNHGRRARVPVRLLVPGLWRICSAHQEALRPLPSGTSSAVRTCSMTRSSGQGADGSLIPRSASQDQCRPPAFSKRAPHPRPMTKARPRFHSKPHRNWGGRAAPGLRIRCHGTRSTPDQAFYRNHNTLTFCSYSLFLSYDCDMTALIAP